MILLDVLIDFRVISLETQLEIIGSIRQNLHHINTIDLLSL